MRPAGFGSGPSTLSLDLTVILSDGSTVHAQADVPIQPRSSNLNQQTKRWVG